MNRVAMYANGNVMPVVAKDCKVRFADTLLLEQLNNQVIHVCTSRSKTKFYWLVDRIDKGYSIESVGDEYVRAGESVRIFGKKSE